MRFFFYLLLICSMAIISCKNNVPNVESQEQAESEQHAHDHNHDHDHKHEYEHDEHHDHEHQHVFYCPYHPEIESAEPGICAFCGTELEFLEDENMLRYSANFRMEPQEITAGDTVKVYFKPFQVHHKNNILPLQKSPKLIVVNEAFTIVKILQPIPAQNGEYEADLLLNEEDDYTLYFDFMPKNALPKYNRQQISVGENNTGKSRLKNEKRSWQKNGYTVKLQTGKPFEFNISALLKTTVLKDGKPINSSVENADLYIISEDKKHYLHTKQLATDAQPDYLAFHTLFPQKGFYKIILQFTHNGQQQLADFVLEVKA